MSERDTDRQKFSHIFQNRFVCFFWYFANVWRCKNGFKNLFIVVVVCWRNIHKRLKSNFTFEFVHFIFSKMHFFHVKVDTTIDYYTNKSKKLLEIYSTKSICTHDNIYQILRSVQHKHASINDQQQKAREIFFLI